MRPKRMQVSGEQQGSMGQLRLNPEWEQMHPVASLEAISHESVSRNRNPRSSSRRHLSSELVHGPVEEGRSLLIEPLSFEQRFQRLLQKEQKKHCWCGTRDGILIIHFNGAEEVRLCRKCSSVTTLPKGRCDERGIRTSDTSLSSDTQVS